MGSTLAEPAHSYYSEYDLSSGNYVEVGMFVVDSTSNITAADSATSGFGMDWLRSTP